ncbi:MAG TPA: energy transducer TonB [Gemmatimonadales bacterium]|nr:energy transducer TonB [Gemmatimonadales bacterium]
MRSIPLRGLLLVAALAGCRTQDDPSMMHLPADRPATAPLVDGPPVALNVGSPMPYPPALISQKIDGTVVLRLFVTEAGAVVPESTRVAESSGYPALDSAAIAGVPQLRFAPALRDGNPVAAAFLQPVHFRHARGGR